MGLAVIPRDLGGSVSFLQLLAWNPNSCCGCYSSGRGNFGASNSIFFDPLHSSTSRARSSRSHSSAHCSSSGRSSSHGGLQLSVLRTHFASHGKLSLHLVGDAPSELGNKAWRRKSPVHAKGPNDEGDPVEYSSDTKIRSEVISPFRSVRMFFYLAFIASATIGSVITAIRLAAALGGAPNAQPILETVKDLGIDLAAVITFALLYRSDSRARDISLAKISREEILSTLRVELINKKVVTLQQLRGVARIVIISGSSSYIKEAFQRSEPFKTDLLQRGVLVVPYALDGGGPVPDANAGSGTGGGGSVAVQEKPATERWTATPIYTSEWSRWLKGQKKLANVAEDQPVYISLRLDGRVRGSGVGFPPWEKFAVQLPPMSGMWKGPLDGLDGRI